VDPDSLGRRISVAVVEDHQVVVEGIRSWLAADGRAEVTAAGDSIEEVLGGAGAEADVIVLDLTLGMDMVTERVAGLSDAGHRVVVFSMHSKPLTVRTVMAAGACAFLDKASEQHHFVDTVLTVARDGAVMTPSMAGGILVEVAGLSGRQKEVLRYLFQGMSHAAIARRLKKENGEPVSAHTVKQYVDRARARFAAAGRPCRSNFALLARCIEDGLIRPEEIRDYRPDWAVADSPQESARVGSAGRVVARG
jgi:two-component system, NarL family, nitrate/nitrite response regulator NarL